MDGSTAQATALRALVEIAENKSERTDLRLEAAKLIVNRPRFFVNDEEV
jgi:hypothetical protein